MAFLNFSDPAAGPSTPMEVAAVGFTPDEWLVIRFARQDSLASLRAPGWLARVGRWLFGLGRDPRLADPRLETLRSVAVHAWHHGYAIPQSAVLAFDKAGFSLDQLEEMLASIGAGRLERRR
jgi:hypothetical protein